MIFLCWRSISLFVQLPGFQWCRYEQDQKTKWVYKGVITELYRMLKSGQKVLQGELTLHL